MADQPEKIPDKIVVPSNIKPSLLNRTILDGALLASLFAQTMRGFAVTGAIGAAIGSVVGLKQQQKEREHGKEVSKPAGRWIFMTNGALLGGLGGALLSTPAILSGAPMATAITAATVSVAGALGIYLGNGAHGKRSREYDQAITYYREHGGHYQGRAAELEREKATPAAPQKISAITAEEAEQLHQRLNALEKQLHAERAARAPEAAAGPAR